MIVVRIELWPCGRQERARVMAVGKIWNTCQGTPNSGDYLAEIYGGTSAGIPPEKADRPWDTMRPWKRCEVKGFPRRIQGSWDLLCRALWTMIGSRTDRRPPVPILPGPDGVIDLTGGAA